MGYRLWTMGIGGIEIFHASKKIDLKTILSYTLEFKKRIDNSENCPTIKSSGCVPRPTDLGRELMIATKNGKAKCRVSVKIPS